MEWRQAMACVENSCKQISDTLSLHQRSKKRYIFEFISTPNLHENNVKNVLASNILKMKNNHDLNCRWWSLVFIIDKGYKLGGRNERKTRDSATATRHTSS